MPNIIELDDIDTLLDELETRVTEIELPAAAAHPQSLRNPAGLLCSVPDRLMQGRGGARYRGSPKRCRGAS